MLKTEWVKRPSGTWSFGYSDESLRHDSIYAHALVMALEEHRQERGLILDRAAELMAEWGFKD